MADSASWPSYGRDQSNQRYSPLSGIPHAIEASPVVVVPQAIQPGTVMPNLGCLRVRPGASRLSIP
jgi:hypothetical protein